MTALAWKINRLKLMGPAEVLWRVRQLARRKAAAMGLGLASYPPVPALDRFGAAFVATPVAVDAAALCMEADALLAGRWNVFALQGAPLGFPPQWNRDPRSGTTAPMAPGPSIDYRDASLVGDIKYL